MQLLVSVVTLILSTGVASAHTYTWIGLTSQWSSPLNWVSLTGLAYPGASSNDIAIIGCPLLHHPGLDADVSIRGMTISNCGRVNSNGHNLEITGRSSVMIHNYGKLVLSGTGDKFILSGGGKAEIAGCIEMAGYQSQIRFESSIEICGVDDENGRVVSDLADNGVIFSNGISVGSTLTFSGSMYFEADDANGAYATFRNYGVVSADFGNGIDLLPSIRLLDSSGAIHWRAFGAMLAFHRSSNGSDASYPVLAGDFDIDDCGELRMEFGVQIETTGDLTQSGTISFAGGGGYFSDRSYFMDSDFTTLDCSK